jgi:hypothetical protein
MVTTPAANAVAASAAHERASRDINTPETR